LCRLDAVALYRPFSLEKSLRANFATTRFRRRKSLFCVALPTRIKDLQQKTAVIEQYESTFQGKTRDLLHLFASQKREARNFP